MCCRGRHRGHWIESVLKSGAAKYGQQAERRRAMKSRSDTADRAPNRRATGSHHGQSSFSVDEPPRKRVGVASGRAALEQARLIMLVMVNVAQLWILAATVEAALAHNYQQIWPLVVASGVCLLISISMILWWKPASRRYTSTGYLRDRH